MSKHRERLIGEINELFETRDGLEKHVAVFGSARLPETHPACVAAYEISKRLSEAGINICNGGGPAVMAASSKGAKEGKNGLSITHTITLPFEEEANPHVDITMEHEYFAIRKFGLLQASKASVYVAGGWGTLDEFAALACLLTTGKMRKEVDYPVVLFGTKFWKGLFDWVENTLLPEGTISEKDIGRFYITDSVDDAVSHILEKI